MDDIEIQNETVEEPEFQAPPSVVYVRVDSQNTIVEINSSDFITPNDSWIKIDEGYGDKYHHAQGNYLPKPIMSMEGSYNYKLVDGKPVERTEYDKAPETQESANYSEAADLQRKLEETDYVALKIAEGVATKEEYADTLALRDQWRRRLGELKSMKLIGR